MSETELMLEERCTPERNAELLMLLGLMRHDMGQFEARDLLRKIHDQPRIWKTHRDRQQALDPKDFESNEAYFEKWAETVYGFDDLDIVGTMTKEERDLLRERVLAS